MNAGAPSRTKAQQELLASARWGQERRLEFIDFRLRWDGRLNRSDLTAFFAISVPQASLDIARYVELAPANLEYDRSARVYLATTRFKAVFAASSPERFLNELLGVATGAATHEPSVLSYQPPVAVVIGPGRTVNVDVLVALQRAIRELTGVRVVYQSLTRAEPSERVLSPHAFGHDGYRWHVRAYCHERGDFRDFVIARMLSIRGSAPVGHGQADDAQWNTSVQLVLAAHPDLASAHRRAVELDYGMVDGSVTIACRQAMLFYVLRHLRLDLAAPEPRGQQIVLKNKREVERFLAVQSSG
jgi:hypothetical protein